MELARQAGLSLRSVRGRGFATAITHDLLRKTGAHFSGSCVPWQGENWLCVRCRLNACIPTLSARRCPRAATSSRRSSAAPRSWPSPLSPSSSSRIVAVLYFAKPFFLPVVLAFVVGTMLSPAANLLERYKIPRAVGAILIVTAVTATIVIHDRPDLLAPDGLERAPARTRRAAERQAACVRPAAGAVAGAADHDRRARHRARSSAPEIRLGAARPGIPVADFHRRSCCSSPPWCCSSRAGAICAVH